MPFLTFLIRLYRDTIYCWEEYNMLCSPNLKITQTNHYLTPFVSVIGNKQKNKPFPGQLLAPLWTVSVSWNDFAKASIKSTCQNTTIVLHLRIMVSLSFECWCHFSYISCFHSPVFHWSTPAYYAYHTRQLMPAPYNSIRSQPFRPVWTCTTL